MARRNKKDNTAKMGTVLIQLECPKCHKQGILPLSGDDIIDDIWESLPEGFTLSCPEGCGAQLYVTPSKKPKPKTATVWSPQAKVTIECIQTLDVMPIN